MWSTTSNTWKPASGNRWENRVEHHAGMSAANQRGRRSILRRRVIAKQTVSTQQYAAAARNLEVLLNGGGRGPSN